MKNLVFRVLTAVVAVPIILGLLYLLPWWAFGLLAFAAQGVAALEFFQFSHRQDRLGQTYGLVLSSLVFWILLDTNFGDTNSFATALVLLALVPASLLFTLFRPGDQSSALLRMSALVLGPMYVGVSLAAVGSLRRVALGGGDHVGAGLVVLTLMIAWLSDTGGYFFGKGLKGPKLYPAVSPNKTWSGAVGGLLGSALGAVLAHFWYLPELPLGRGLAVAVIAGAFGQAGDLCESLMKRSAGVKDSGGILPGHGGILDRLDAVMFVGLALYAAVRSGWLFGP
jgi:phosphatidate cytidylyltransferase